MKGEIVIVTVPMMMDAEAGFVATTLNRAGTASAPKTAGRAAKATTMRAKNLRTPRIWPARRCGQTGKRGTIFRVAPARGRG
jgi:hypothetical protein